jgi:cyclic pyranopterin monophosphate synthase
MKKPRLSHFDRAGKAAMVDVGAKAVTARTATAKAVIAMQPATLRLIQSGTAKKGDVLGVARLAGIMAAKRTHELIPLCHPLPLNQVKVDFLCKLRAAAVEITATCKVSGQTGVEMEALTAVAVAALTIYDMCKAVDRGMTISDLRVVMKSGGKSGTYKEKRKR